MDDKIEPKTEHVLESSTEPTDHELATPLPSDESLLFQTENEQGESLSSERVCVSELNNANVPEHQQSIVGKNMKVTNGQSELNKISYDSHGVNPTSLSTEIVVHRFKEAHNSSSIDTANSDIDIGLPTEETVKPNENSSPEYDHVFCLATICRLSKNNTKLLAISQIDTNIKVDVKSDGSFNGYAADRSGSSSNSTICHVEEPFLIPKIPRDSLVSSSSSGSSIGGILQHVPKSKSNNILLSKNVYTYPENLICSSCNCKFPRVSDSYSLDCKDFKNKPPLKTDVEKSNRRKTSKQLNINSESKKTIKKKKACENIFSEKIDIKQEEQSYNLQINSQEIIDPITFNQHDKVLAFWGADKMFYPATIIEVVSSKYKVEFMSDYYVKPLNADALVHSKALKTGSSIAIFDTVSQEYRVGDIISINDMPNGEKTYTIDLDSEKVVVPFDKLVLDLEKARMLQDKVVFKNYDRLSLSNVSEGKRIRLSRSTNNTTNKKNVSSKRKRNAGESPGTKKRKCLFPEKNDPRNIPSTSTGITEEGYIMSCQFTGSSDSDFDHIREDLTSINMGQLRTSDIDSEHSSPEKCGALASESSPVSRNKELFKNLCFVFSYAKFKHIPTANESDLSGDSALLSNSSYFKPFVMKKKELSSKITKYGGSVFRYTNLIPKSCYKYSYILTDTPSYTCNFVLGLTLGIPSYHHKYIDDVISQNLPFTEFLVKNNIKPIPNGWSVEKKSVIFRSPTTVHKKLFSDYIIYVSFDENGKTIFFSNVLRFCGAIVYTSWENGVHSAMTTHYTTVIVTDESCPNILARAPVPKLSLAWVVQSLICESPRPFDAHESFIAIQDEQE